VLLACLLCPGLSCATPRGAVFEPLEDPLVWPPPPDHPRVAYVGALETTADLKAGTNVFESIGAALFGEADVRSMLTPFAVTTDDNRVFICDSNAQLVHVFDLEDRTYEQWTTNRDEGLAQPVGIAVAADGRVFVSDSVAGSIAVFAADGAFVGRIAGEHLERPCGLAFDHTANRLYVADAAAHVVVVLTSDGAPLTRIGRRGTALGQFNYPTAVAVDSEGRLLVSDTLNFRVQVFSRDLEPIRQIGSKGDLPGYFAQPKGIALDSEDHLYVVDAHFEAVQVFRTDGRLLMTFGQEGRGPGQFWLPAGIHIDPQDRIWVADSYNRRVQVFRYLPEASP
jgi:DNA-binding beta-propeller fold protein YncE